MRINLGCVDIPYTDSSETTFGVASILEEKYGVMQTFFDLHSKDIADQIANSIATAIEQSHAGVETPDVFAGSMSKTEEMFRTYLDKEEMAGIIKGVPTQAALDGKNSRKKYKSKKQGKRRPSFIDSSLYRISFRAWVDK